MLDLFILLENFFGLLGRFFLLVISLISLSFSQARAQAQAQKGISFQIVIKKPDGTYPSALNKTVKLLLLEPINNCVLREETHSGVSITNGYINLIIGDSSATTLTVAQGGLNPDSILNLTEVMDNKTTRTNLNCVGDADNVLTTSSYVPSASHTRKVRLILNVDGDDIVADFNIRAVGFALSADTLNGKTENSFINVDPAVTLGTDGVSQANVDSIFNRYTKLNAILNSFNAAGDQLSSALFGNIDASKITTGTFGNSRISQVSISKLLSDAFFNYKPNGTPCLDAAILKYDAAADAWKCAVESGGGGIPPLASGQIFVGNVSNLATAVTMSGDASLSNSGQLTLANSGVTAGTYSKVSVDVKGRVTASSNLALSDITSALGFTPANVAGDTLSGALVTPSGSAAAPALGIGQTSSGLFSDGSNVLAASTAGIERMRIDSAGKVGIGTTAPRAALDVSSGQAVGSFFDAGTNLIINFDQGNMQTTDAAAGTLTLNNMKAGGSYTLILTNASGGNFTLSASGYTFKCQPQCVSNAVIVNPSATTVITIIATNATAYVAWIRGF